MGRADVSLIDRMQGVGRVDNIGHDAEMNQARELMIAQGAMRYTEMTRKGQVYGTMATGAVAASAAASIACARRC